jgi:hypothetical protein
MSAASFPVIFGSTNLAGQALSVLAKFGTNAHVYLPGIGVVNGINAANYLDSAGTTAATVDNPVGLALDAVQGAVLGSELAPGFASATGWTLGSGITISGGKLNFSSVANNESAGYPSVGVVSGNTYVLSITVESLGAGGPVGLLLSGGAGVSATGVGTFTSIAKATGSGQFYVWQQGASATTAVISSISVKQVPGTHATQSTTANKPILRYANGRYSHEYNGSTNYLALGAPLFQMSDDHAVIAGAMVNSASACVLFSENGGVNPRLQLYTVSGVLNCDWADDSALTSNANISGVQLATPFVASMRKVTNTKLVRKNAVASTASNTVLGATTLTNAVIGCNAISGTPANFMSGQEYPLIAIKGTVSDADLLTLERFVGSLSGVSF